MAYGVDVHCFKGDTLGAMNNLDSIFVWKWSWRSHEEWALG
mgnify:CR=1 FL=1